MAEVIWLTDIHLDLASSEVREEFFLKLKTHPSKTILVGGDTADGPLSHHFLKEMAKITQKKIYFILGNHDFYGLSIGVQKERTKALSKENSALCYLTGHDPIPLSPTVALIGHDGWADGRENGESFLTSALHIRDYVEIEELKGRTPSELQEALFDLGDEAAKETEEKLLLALDSYQKVLFITHAPPFRAACMYEGKITGSAWAPHFVSQVMGRMLKRVLEKYPEKECLVLAGHSHHEAHVQVLPNLKVQVAESCYGAPRIQTLSI